jgi:uncharacterized protein YcbK (DUF882 family)
MLVAVMLAATFASGGIDADGPPGDAARSKKAKWLSEKDQRLDVRARPAPRPGLLPPAVLTLHNMWTDELLPVVLQPGGRPAPELSGSFDELTRCHYTNQATRMDPRLFGAVVRAAAHFHARTVELVSGYRAPKYQLMLRKKGHEVARDSQHPRGQAIDFRLPQVPTKVLLRFVKSLRLGGVGYYPESRFVHCDVGRQRYWRGH